MTVLLPPFLRGGVFKCTSAGAPGTWKQILPAAVTADPASGTIPTGYPILNVTQGTLKRHAGSYDWQTVIGATAGDATVPTLKKESWMRVAWVG